jgi:hypothetical protein
VVRPNHPVKIIKENVSRRIWLSHGTGRNVPRMYRKNFRSIGIRGIQADHII